jgi:hypothetical protein
MHGNDKKCVQILAGKVISNIAPYLWGAILKYGAHVSFHILSNSLFTDDLIVRSVS